MSRNILLLYLSKYKPNVIEGRYDRSQTNETALMKLIDEKNRPERILALCSEVVRKEQSVEPDAGHPEKRTALEYYQDFLKTKGFGPEALEIIPVPDSLKDTDRVRAIEALLSKIQEGDELYIDLSGGLRDMAMLMVAAARCMRDLRGVETRQVLCAELKGNRSTAGDCTLLYDLFDLISAMDEFFSTGRARKLKSYLNTGGTANPDLHLLLEKINDFSDHLALCQVKELKADLKAIAKARRKFSGPAGESKTLNDLFFRLLNDRFGTEFQSLLEDRENRLPALVKWCTAHGMYQQALTLLCEEMPDYVCSHVLLQPTPAAWEYMNGQPLNEGKPWSYPLFHFHFCQLRCPRETNWNPLNIDLKLTKDKTENDGNPILGIASEEEMHSFFEQMKNGGLLLLDEKRQAKLESAALAYQKVMQYRNQINHASGSASGLPQSDRVLKLDTERIETVLYDTAELLQSIRPLKPCVPEGEKLLPLAQKLGAEDRKSAG